MNIHFEELSAAQRAGGIDAATDELVEHLRAAGASVTRSSRDQLPSSRPDCVHFHGIWSPDIAMRFRRWRKRGVPSVWSPHGMLEPWALAHKRAKKKLAWHVYQRRLLQMADALHATSSREAANLSALRLGVPTCTIPWGVRLPDISDVASRRSDGGSSARTALFVGRIYPVKGLPLLVDAWAQVRPRGWKMLVVGPDEAGHRAEVEALIRKKGVGDDFEFAGELTGSAKSAAYREADLFILPSHTENFGMAIGEALAHELPVITTRGAPWQLLEEQGCGWWTLASVSGLAEAFRAATMKSHAELAAMGRIGRRVVAERFSWPRVADEFLHVYRWIVGSGPRPKSVVA